MILAFAEYDTNNSGEISKQELLDWCSKYGDITDNIDSLISGADFNGDGKINYDEFICMVVKKQIWIAWTKKRNAHCHLVASYRSILTLYDTK